MIELRVRLFYDLHKNKWFHLLNLSLEVIKTTDTSQKIMLSRFATPLFQLNTF